MIWEVSWGMFSGEFRSLDLERASVRVGEMGWGAIEAPSAFGLEHDECQSGSSMAGRT